MIHVALAGAVGLLESLRDHASSRCFRTDVHSAAQSSKRGPTWQPWPNASDSRIVRRSRYGSRSVASPSSSSTSNRISATGTAVSRWSIRRHTRSKEGRPSPPNATNSASKTPVTGSVANSGLRATVPRGCAQPQVFRLCGPSFAERRSRGLGGSQEPAAVVPTETEPSKTARGLLLLGEWR